MKRFLLISFMVGICGSVLPVSRANAQSYMQLADSAEYSIKRERWGDAEQFLKRALRLQPAYKGNSMLLSNLGIVQTHLGKYGEAIQSYDVGLAIGRDSVALLNNRAYTYLTMSDSDLALADLGMSLSLDSVQEWPLKMSGLIYLKKKEWDHARPRFESLMRHFPDNSSGPSGLGAISAASMDYAGALRWYEMAISVSPTEEDWFYKVLMECRLGKENQAYDDIRAALKEFPRSGNLYALHGYILRRRFQYAEAEQSRRIALDNGAEPQIIEELFGSE